MPPTSGLNVSEVVPFPIQEFKSALNSSGRESNIISIIFGVLTVFLACAAMAIAYFQLRDSRLIRINLRSSTAGQDDVPVYVGGPRELADV